MYLGTICFFLKDSDTEPEVKYVKDTLRRVGNHTAYLFNGGKCIPTYTYRR